LTNNMSSTTAAVVYALSPGQANDQPIDYNTTWGQKQYAEATKKLSDQPYEGGPQNLKMFLERLNSRAEESGWTEITKINNKDLFTQYGTITIDDCKKEATKYLALDANNKLVVNKRAQMSAQMLSCIQASISDECTLKVVTSGDKFKVEISNGSCSVEIANGPLYLRILISRITIDSRSTVSYLLKSLSELDNYMTSIDCNVTTFNGFVRLQMDALNARGETSSDILINLFKGYLAVPDKEFKMYIKQKKNDYE